MVSGHGMQGLMSAKAHAVSLNYDLIDENT